MYTGSDNHLLSGYQCARLPMYHKKILKIIKEQHEGTNIDRAGHENGVST